jgi:hypothetical protein
MLTPDKHVLCNASDVSCIARHPLERQMHKYWFKHYQLTKQTDGGYVMYPFYSFLMT